MATRLSKLKENRKLILCALRSAGFQEVERVSFMDDHDASVLGSRLHETICKTKERQIEGWNEVRPHILKWVAKYDSVVVFENRWDVGALIADGHVVGSNLDAIYQVVGPDFYCATPDLCHGAIFDKEEYSCYLKIW